MTEFEHGLNITPQDVVDAVEQAVGRSRRTLSDPMQVAAERFVWELVAPNIAIIESPFGTPTVLVPERWRYEAWPEYEQGREILSGFYGKETDAIESVSKSAGKAIATEARKRTEIERRRRNNPNRDDHRVPPGNKNDMLVGIKGWARLPGENDDQGTWGGYNAIEENNS